MTRPNAHPRLTSTSRHVIYGQPAWSVFSKRMNGFWGYIKNICIHIWKQSKVWIFKIKFSICIRLPNCLIYSLYLSIRIFRSIPCGIVATAKESDSDVMRLPKVCESKLYRGDNLEMCSFCLACVTWIHKLFFPDTFYFDIHCEEISTHNIWFMFLPFHFYYLLIQNPWVTK